MYIMQFCNTFSQEILRENKYTTADEIMDTIEQMSNEEFFDLMVLDSKMRLLRADYVTYKVYPDGNDMIYKLFFRVQLAEIQPLLNL